MVRQETSRLVKEYGNHALYLEIVDKCIFLGVLIKNDGYTDKDLRRRLAMGNVVMGSLNGLFKDRGIRLTTTIMIV